MDELTILRRTVNNFVDNSSKELCLDLLAQLTGCVTEEPAAKVRKCHTDESIARMLETRAANKKKREEEAAWKEVEARR